jgi:hypothetical protein
MDNKELWWGGLKRGRQMMGSGGKQSKGNRCKMQSNGKRKVTDKWKEEKNEGMMVIGSERLQRVGKKLMQRRRGMMV